MNETSKHTETLPSARRLSSHLARRTSLAFALFGALWILLSDWVLAVVAPQPVEFAAWQTYKGWIFIGVSTLIVYGILARAEQKQGRANAALAASEARYRLLFASNPHPMWVYDVETLHFLEVNAAAVEQYGFTQAEFLTMTLPDIRPAEDAPRLHETVAGAMPPLHYAGEWQHRKKNGEIFSVEVTSHRLEFAGRPARLVVAMDISARKRAENALRTSEQMLARSQQIAHVGHWRWDLDSNRIESSEEMQRIFGISSKLYIGDMESLLAQDIHPEDLEDALAQLQEFMEAGLMREGEYRIVRPDGEVRIIWAIPADCVSDAAGRIVQLSGVVQDITERKRIEAQQRLQAAALESTANSIVITNIDGIIEWVNPAFTELTGYTLAESIGHNPSELVRSGLQDAAFYEKMWQSILAGNVWRGELTNRRKDGELYIEEQTITPVLDEQGQVSHFVGVKQDITARKAAETERNRLLETTQAQAAQMLQIMHSVPEGVLLLDNEGRILVANALAQDYLAHHLASPDILVENQPLTQLGDCLLTHLLSSPPQGAWHTIKAGQRIFEGIAWPVAGELTPGSWVVVLHDVTEARFIAQQLQRQERLAAVGQLAAGIAHDFNNIMSVISAYAQMTMQAPGLSARERERVIAIDQQALRATRMIRQILDFSRSSAVDRQPLDLLELLREQIILLQQTLSEHIEVEFTVDQSNDAPFLINGDPTRLQQIVMNLAVNARDAIAESGFLRFALAHVTVAKPKEAPLPGMKAGQWVQLTVADTGGGMSSEIMDHIFEPFFTTKAPGQGTGLGLAQVHGIIAQHDGQITVASQPGEGTRFDIFLPAAAPVASALPSSRGMSAPVGHGEHILLVEDHAALRVTLTELVTGWNYRVEAAVNGEDALARLEAAAEPFRLIISDVVMPKLGGVGLLKALRKRKDTIPLILLTGHPMRDELEPLREFGLWGWLTKPPDAEQLAQMVAEALA